MVREVKIGHIRGEHAVELNPTPIGAELTGTFKEEMRTTRVGAKSGKQEFIKMGTGAGPL